MKTIFFKKNSTILANRLFVHTLLVILQPISEVVLIFSKATN